MFHVEHSTPLFPRSIVSRGTNSAVFSLEHLEFTASFSTVSRRTLTDLNLLLFSPGTFASILFLFLAFPLITKKTHPFHVEQLKPILFYSIKLSTFITKMFHVERALIKTNVSCETLFHKTLTVFFHMKLHCLNYILIVSCET